MNWKTLLSIIVLGIGPDLALGYEVRIESQEGEGRAVSQDFESAAQPSGGTVAHWRFTGKPGAVPETGDKIQDAGGRWPATIFGRPVYRAVEGISGLEFNGGNDRVFVADDPAFGMSGSFTLEAIIRCDGIFPGSEFQNQIVMRGDDRAGLDPWVLAVALDGRLMFQIQDANNRYVQLLSPGPLPTGRIVHVAGVFTAETKQLDLYIDGKRVSSAETNLRPMARLDAGASPGVGIGNVQSGTYRQGFNGLIAEVRITSGALRPVEFLRVRKGEPSEAHPRERVPRTKRGRTYRETPIEGKLQR